MAKKALGKGLGALINAQNSAALSLVEHGDAQKTQGKVLSLELSRIVPSPLQPRKHFRDEHFEELSESIRQHGIIQPLLVRKVSDHFELIAGERRWRSAKAIGMETVPAILRQASDLEVLEMALIENLQREDLNPLEEAQAYARLSREFHQSQEEIARKVGKSRAAVANSIRLLELDSEVQSLLISARITVGHAKVILGVKSAPEQRNLAQIAIRENYTVRQTERLVEAHLAKLASAGDVSASKRRQLAVAISPSLQRIQNKIREHLATEIHIRHGAKKGRIEITYYGNDDLDRLLGILGVDLED